MHQPATRSATPPIRLRTLMIFAAGVLLTVFEGCTPPQTEERVVAFVNGRPITQTEFEAEWAELPDATKSRYEKEGGKPRLLSEVITRELLLQEARKQGLDQSDQIRDRARRYKEKLMLDELLKDRIKAKIELTKEELDAYYEKHSRQLLTPLKVRVSQMLLPNYPAAKDLEKQVNLGGDFARFAQRYSIDMKTKANGGDLGPYRKDLVVHEVDDVIHTLRPGMISAPIKTEAGYYLVKITPLDPEIIQADLAIRERLRQELLNEKRQKRFDDVIADIRAKAVVKIADASRYGVGDLANR
ncbi:putative Peptidylprolyl isomerase, PpiC-type [Nitrospira sp. KM1]|uniref:peptidylprolyl isomerase n=1 Tax=Nitrospira sp. KM1 TaxID=1936990 RepID=UPI0013A7947C|nr:peptidylprolyl isomerase [Nitrospira sp. KM1]BCA55152.1 putative Peptidylprolyl isomerase, PpiC-type [Nitrospira sp. KM1]